MKILCLIPGLDYSGSRKMLAWVANQLCAEHVVEVCVFFQAKKPEMLDRCVKLTQLNIQRSHHPLLNKTIGLIHVLRRISDHVHEAKPDLVISFGDIFSMLVMRQKKHFGCRYLLSERVDPTVKNMLSSLRKALFRYADVVVFQTEGAQACFDVAIRSKSKVIPNPVIREGAEHQETAVRKKAIAYVGRFELKQKRQDLMIEAFARFHAHYPSYQLNFYGDGGDMNKVKALVAEKKLQDHVVFWGAVKNVKTIIKDSAMLVMTSDYEGIPNVLIEAMDAGVPVVSTDCSPGGAKLLLGKSQFGQLVPCGDVPAICAAMEWIVQHPEEAEDKALRAVQSLDRFREDVIAQAWKDAIPL